jgi:hypothetical protein
VGRRCSDLASRGIERGDDGWHRGAFQPARNVTNRLPLAIHSSLAVYTSPPDVPRPIIVAAKVKPYPDTHLTVILAEAYTDRIERTVACGLRPRNGLLFVSGLSRPRTWYLAQ